MGTTERFRPICTAVLTVALAVVLSGCAGASPGPGTASMSSTMPTATASAPVTPEATVLPTPSALPTSPPPPSAPPETPTNDPIATATTCGTALSAAEYDQLATDGLTFRDEAPNQNLDSLMQDGGIRCLWRVPNTDIEAWYAQWPSDQATWTALSAQLTGAGATPSDDGFDGILQSEYNSTLTYRDGTVYYASPPRLLGSVLALQ
jgi:hypothetical protein